MENATLIERIADAKKRVKKVLKENPEFNTIWMEFKDIPMDQLREAAKKYRQQIQYVGYAKRMVLQLSQISDLKNITCFCYSAEMKVETHYVENTVVNNV